MKLTRVFSVCVFALLFFMLICTRASAGYLPQQADTVLQGYVLGSGSAGIQPIDWALIRLKGTDQSFQVFSGITGFYQIYLPGGAYNVTVSVPVDPTYLNYSTSLTIPNDTTTQMNFQLQRVLTVGEIHQQSTLVIILSASVLDRKICTL
jgi:hypothetical protein